MSELISLPDSIRRLISGKAYLANNVGMSKAQVRVFEDCVLKIEKFRKKNEETVKIMQWLDGKLPVPKILCYESDDNFQYLLMSRVSGRMACDSWYMEHPKELIAGLAEALQMLWSIDITDCPCSRNLDTRLKEAAWRVENHMVDMNNAESSTFGKGGFRDPEDLLRWLEDNRPNYKPVLSHGDLCLPNVFLDRNGVSGLIDLGDTGLGDRWMDIALCHRSLRWNSEGAYGGRICPDIRSDMLFDVLGITPEPEKIRYYILLDELF